MDDRYSLAQVNIARMRLPLEDPEMESFVALLDEINALAEGSPGFVWRFQGAEGNATYLRPYDDDRILFNMSVWESIDALSAYAYESAHAAVMRRRREWFTRFEQRNIALWWIRAGSIPSVGEALERLRYLQEHGPTTYAFTFKSSFGASSDGLALPETEKARPCGAP
jgi:heme-degrading monooxygenase HmoA